MYTLHCPHRQVLGMNPAALTQSIWEVGNQPPFCPSQHRFLWTLPSTVLLVHGGQACAESTQQTATSHCSCVTCCWHGLSALHKADCRDGCSNLTCGLNLRPSFPTLLSHHTAAIPMCQLLPTLAVSSASVLLYLIIPWLGLSLGFYPKYSSLERLPLSAQYRPRNSQPLAITAAYWILCRSLWHSSCLLPISFFSLSPVRIEALCGPFVVVS